MWSYLKRKDGSLGNSQSTPRDKKDERYRTALYTVRLPNMVRTWLEDFVPRTARSRWVEAAIVYCIQLQKDQRLDDPATAFRSGLYVGFCKGVVYAREETGHNIDAEIERLWAAFAQEIAQSPPRHCQAPIAGADDEPDRPADRRDPGAGPDRRATGRSSHQQRCGRIPPTELAPCTAEGLRGVRSFHGERSLTGLAVWPAATATRSGAETLQRRHGEVANLPAVRHAIDPDRLLVRAQERGAGAASDGARQRRVRRRHPPAVDLRSTAPSARDGPRGGRAGKWRMEVDHVHALCVGCPRYGAQGRLPGNGDRPRAGSGTTARVAPDLRLGQRAVGLEDAPRPPTRPRSAGRSRAPSPRNCVVAIRPTMISLVPGLNMRPLDEPHLLADPERRGLDAAQRDMGDGARGPVRDVDDDEELG